MSTYEARANIGEDRKLEIVVPAAFVGANVRVIVESPNGAAQQPDSQFHALVDQWKRDTLNVSSMTRMVLHPAYQQIVGMGPPALAPLLEELDREPDWWFAALAAIAGVDPVPAPERGNLAAMKRRWMEWGRLHGHVHN